jgi:hypothetical protein
MARKNGDLIFNVRIQHILQGVEYSLIKRLPKHTHKLWTGNMW